MRFTSDHGRTWLRWLPATLLLAAIFVFSSVPGKTISASFDGLRVALQISSPIRSRVPVLSPRINWLKVGHGIGYLCLGFVVLYALKRAPGSPLTALIICSLCAVADEFHQDFVPGRSATGRDILLDSLASLLGILILLGILKWKDHRKSGEIGVRSA